MDDTSKKREKYGGRGSLTACLAEAEAATCEKTMRLTAEQCMVMRRFLSVAGSWYAAQAQLMQGGSGARATVERDAQKAMALADIFENAKYVEVGK